MLTQEQKIEIMKARYEIVKAQYEKDEENKMEILKRIKAQKNNWNFITRPL